MININLSTMIYRPIKQVFDYVTAPENDFQWQYGTLETNKVAGVGGVPGTFFRSIGHLMGRRVLGTYEVTECEPDRKYGFKSLSGPLHIQTCYTFEIADGGTRVNVSMQARVVNFYEIDEGILEKHLKKQIREDLALLKELLEERRMLPVLGANESARLNSGIAK